MASSSAQSTQATQANFSFVTPAGLLDPSHPYFLNPGDNPATPLVTVVFNGNNYYAWARSMRLALLAKNKLSLIDPAVAPPSPGEPLHSAWERCNVMVLGWIYRSLAPDIAQSILWFDSAIEVWRDLQDRFSEASLIRISDLQDEVFSFKQGTASVSEFFTRFRVLWDELVTLRPFPTCSCTPRCSCGALNLVRTYQQSDQIIRFLKGLNDNFAQIRSQILLMDPLPSITRVFSLVIQHERQISPSGASSLSAPLAMAGQASGRSSGPSQGQGRGAGNRQRPVCTHCGGVGHTHRLIPPPQTTCQKSAPGRVSSTPPAMARSVSPLRELSMNQKYGRPSSSKSKQLSANGDIKKTRRRPPTQAASNSIPKKRWS